MKTRVLLIATIILSLLLTSCNTELTPKVLASLSSAIAEDVKTDSSDVFDEIQRNIDLVSKLKTEIQNDQMNGKQPSLKSVIQDIQVVASSYNNLASQRDDIRKAMLKKVSNLEKMRDTVDDEIQILRERKSGYLEQVRTLDNSNAEVYRTRQKALSQAVSYINKSISLWERFNEIQSGIIIETSDISDKIDLFLSMIESSSILFNEALNLLQLQADIEEAIRLFSSDLPKLEELTKSMEQSWGELDSLINAMTGVAQLEVK